jgi:hypothetical protein
MCGDAVQGVRNKIKGMVTEVHVGADSISYTFVSDKKEVLYAYECDLMPYRQLNYSYLPIGIYAAIRNVNIVSANSGCIPAYYHLGIS